MKHEVWLSTQFHIPNSAIYITNPTHRSQTEGSTGLAPDHLSEAGLALDDAVGDAHLTAEGRQEEDDLQRVHVVGDHHQLGLLLLHLRSVEGLVVRQSRWERRVVERRLSVKKLDSL